MCGNRFFVVEEGDNDEEEVEEEGSVEIEEVEDEGGIEIEEFEEERRDEEEVEDEGGHVIQFPQLHGRLHFQPPLHRCILVQLPQF